jgi:hypothetical protein
MSLYDEPDRAAVERIKVAMRSAADASRYYGAAHNTVSGSRAHLDALERELKHALKQSLYESRHAVWRSARLVAAYELAAEFCCLDTFNRLWGELER